MYWLKLKLRDSDDLDESELKELNRNIRRVKNVQSFQSANILLHKIEQENIDKAAETDHWNSQVKTLKEKRIKMTERVASTFEEEEERTRFKKITL